MSWQIKKLSQEKMPPALLQIPEPPKELYVVGEIPTEGTFLCIIGSRKYTNYAKEACEKIIAGLAGYPIVIVSGLALGMDGIAHRAALKTGLPTIAVPGSGLGPKALYPVTNRNIAEEIIESGGALISEFADDFRPRLESFPQRNRIMAGMSHATLIVEAELKSGTLITSKYATEYNRDVFTVPHSIFSKTSEGPHMLLRLGATPITQSSDIVTALGLRPRDELLQMRDYSGCSTDERELISLLSEPLSRDEIIRRLGKPVYATQTIIATMEIKGLIEEVMGEIHLV